MKKEKITCPFCGNVGDDGLHLVSWDERTLMWFCSKCGKEWRMVKGKPKEIHWLRCRNLEI